MTRGSGSKRGPVQSGGLQQATLHLGQRLLETGYGDFDVHFFRDLAEDRTAMAIAIGEVSEALRDNAPLLVRVHSSCLTSECLMGCDCDCAEQLASAMARIAEAGRGIIFYLMQEGRGAGLSAKARDRMIVQASENRVTTFEAYSAMGLAADLRRYDGVASMAKLLGVRGPIQLLTNNPDKARAVGAALADEKIEICGTEPIYGAASSFNSDYLRAKQATGHTLTGLDGDRGALPPERVRVFEPVALQADPGRVVTASYFLPVVLPNAFSSSLSSSSTSSSTSTSASISAAKVERAAAQVNWFRMSVIFEPETARELILLSQGALGDPATLPLPEESIGAGRGAGAIAPMRLGLFDRMPGSARPRRNRLAEALAKIQAEGEGSVLLHCDERLASEADAAREDGDVPG